MAPKLRQAAGEHRRSDCRDALRSRSGGELNCVTVCVKAVQVENTVRMKDFTQLA
ncbi:MAG: hypothetical protein ACYDA9_20815 [Terriglobia bacterium]